MSDVRIIIGIVLACLFLLGIFGCVWCMIKMFEPWEEDIRSRQDAYVKRLKEFKEKHKGENLDLH